MQQFHNIHSGVCLLVGNGENLKLTPPEWFRYPSFGMNTIHLYDGWNPDYYTAVDNRIWREFRNAIEEKFADIPKFIPFPDLDIWQGKNFYRFYHRAGTLIQYPPTSSTLLSDGLVFGNIMQVAMQIAAWMGFTTLLLIGVHHKPGQARNHFWGVDKGMHEAPPVQQWLDEYDQLTRHFRRHGIQILNISEDTHVPETILPRGDWREWRNNEN